MESGNALAQAGKARALLRLVRKPLGKRAALENGRLRGIARQLSELRDADLPAAIMELNQAQFHKETALSARGKYPQLSLFDYLG